MADVLPLPHWQALAGADSDKLHRPGDVFADVRAEGRAMRISYHPDGDVLVISLWSGRTCRATFQLAGDEVSKLSALLADIAGSRPRWPAPDSTDSPDSEQPPAGSGGGSGPVALAS